MIDLEKLRKSKGHILAIVDTKTGEYVPVVNKDSMTLTEWIPVSERLPDHDECIKNNRLFNVSDGNRSYSEWFDYDKQKFGEHTMAGFRVDYAVIAWMPLPEPPEVEE